MTESIAHRGPDGSGTKAFAAEGSRPPAGLGHRRLSIIDPTEAGAQPMAYANGRYWITYNGELYNFRELRAELVGQGYEFRSECDTEVLLAMYARDGEQMLGRLNGIFAFAIWDATEGALFLARDRLGVKPLVYAMDGDTLLFASELKALMLGLGPQSLNMSALSDYLTFLWVPDPDTLFSGIKKLPGGHCATFANGKLEVREYWDMTYAVEHGRTEGDWATQVRESVQGAVRRQMVSDVPIGAFLSGGLDSSAIVAEMSTGAANLQTYTIGMTAGDLAHERNPDDLRYARRVANEFGVEYHERMLSPEIVDLLPTLIWHLDDPVADPATITTYLICAAARERLTVILGGMGGDEIWAGYPRYAAARIGRIADRLPRSLRTRLRKSLEGRLTLGRPGPMRGPRRNLMKLLRGIDQDLVERHLTYTSYYRPDELPAILSADARAAVAGHDPFAHHLEFAERMEGTDWLNRLLYVDMKTYMSCLNLSYTDKMSMAASTEVRVPLLDDEVVELSGRVPPELKLHGRKTKYLLKRSMEGVLPDEIIWRPKAGFSAPLTAWLAGPLRPMVDDLLNPDAVRARGIFDPAAVESIISANTAGTADNALRIWALLVFELWQQRFMDGAAQAQVAA